MKILKEKNRNSRYAAAAFTFIFMFAVLSAANIMIGSVKIPLGDVFSAVFRRNSESVYYDIIWEIRLPRTLACIILGGALALSGFLLQTFFNNPIAGPYVLGISSGAKLAVAVTMVFVFGKGSSINPALMISSAFAGSMLSMGFVLLIARRVRQSAALIVGGVMIGYICSAVTDFVVTFASDESIVNLHGWAQGSFSGISWENVGFMSAAVLSASFVSFLLSKQISAYQLGESYAVSVGVNIRKFRILLVILSSILCACVTAFAGPVSFVGIAVPHLVKALAKTAKPIAVIPLCFLGGAVFCLGCDLIARTAYSPVEMSISSVSAVLGAPVVIYIMAGKTVRN